jgi:hypothetical protein
VELESRYVMARLRAVEERLKAASEVAEQSSEDGPERPSSQYLAGYGRGLLEARAHVRRLREGLAGMSGGD